MLTQLYQLRAFDHPEPWIYSCSCPAHERSAFRCGLRQYVTNCCCEVLLPPHIFDVLGQLPRFQLSFPITIVAAELS